MGQSERNGQAAAMAASRSQAAGHVVLAAGGTGGHLFPAMALAEELQRRGVIVDLMTDMRGDRYGTGFPARTIHKIASATVAGKSPIALARTGYTLLSGLRQARRIFAAERPGCVVGFGGYPSFPPLMAASMAGIPTALHEQNAVMGRANRMLAGRVQALATSFPNARGLTDAQREKARFTGNPVRDAVRLAARRPYDAPDAGGPLRVLVFGGSQGARFFSDLLPEALERMSNAFRARLSLVMQCREEDVARVGAALAGQRVVAEIAPFFKDLPERMASSHLVISRAGASTIAELMVIGRPAILVPLPHAIDNDQLHNARSLAESGGAWCIEQKELTPERLAAEFEGMSSDPSRLANAAAASLRQGRADAVERLADLVQQLSARGLEEAGERAKTKARGTA